MEVTRRDFPRPAFIRDLPAVIARVGPVRVLVLADDDSPAGEVAASRWIDHLPGCGVLLAAPEASLATVRSWAAARKPGVEPLTVPGWRAGDWASASRGLGELDPPPRLIVSTGAYDAYGVLVKRPMEAVIAGLSARFAALFLVHDESFGTLRALDASLLRDRLVVRPWRLRAYRLTVRVVFAVAGLLSRWQGRGGATWRSLP